MKKVFGFLTNLRFWKFVAAGVLAGLHDATIVNDALFMASEIVLGGSIAIDFIEKKK